MKNYMQIILTGQKAVFIKIFIFIFVLFLFLSCAFGFFIYKHAGAFVKEQLTHKCFGIASATAALIENDIEHYKNFIITLDKSSSYYKKTKTALEKIRRDNDRNISFLYVEVRHSTTEIMYTFDSEPEGSKNFLASGTLEPLTPVREKAYDTANAYSGDFINTPWGVLLSAYAPVYDTENNQFIGLVGADISIEHYENIMRYLLILIGGGILALTLTFGSVLIVSTGKIRRMVIIDSLTGVYNKSYFMSNFGRHLRIAQRQETPVTIFIADLDHFKNINDTYGHLFGDRMLEAVSRAIASSLRQTDCLGRYGGEEFVAYLPDLDHESTHTVVERIKDTVAATRVYNPEYDRYISVTISIGVARTLPWHTPDVALKNADDALYEAKKTRNTIVYFEELSAEQQETLSNQPHQRWR